MTSKLSYDQSSIHGSPTIIEIEEEPAQEEPKWLLSPQLTPKADYILVTEKENWKQKLNRVKNSIVNIIMEDEMFLMPGSNEMFVQHD
jgi:hypothetical protein